LDELFYGERPKASSRGDIFLATVDSVSNSGITLIFDGQSTASTKKYKMILTGTTPVAGDRVAVVKHSGTYLILGVIGTASTPSGDYVAKSGDTMTGALTISSGGLEVDSYDVNLDSTVLAVGTAPSIDSASGGMILRDKVKTVFGRIRGFFGSDGRIGTQMITERTVGGSTVYNMLGLLISSTGVRSVRLSDAQIWRSALELGSSGAFPLTIAQGGSGNTGLYSTTVGSDFGAAQTGFSINTCYYAQWGKIALFELKLNITADVSTAKWTTCFVINSSKRPDHKVLIHEFGNKYSYAYSVGDIDVYGTLTNGNTLEFFGIYMLP